MSSVFAESRADGSATQQEGMLARLAAALQRGQLQGLGGAQLGAALGGGGAGTVVVNEDCTVSVFAYYTPFALVAM